MKTVALSARQGVYLFVIQKYMNKIGKPIKNIPFSIFEKASKKEWYLNDDGCGQNPPVVIKSTPSKDWQTVDSLVRKNVIFVNKRGYFSINNGINLRIAAADRWAGY